MKNRIITAIVLAVIFIPLLIIGGLPFEIAISILSLLAIKDILDIIGKEKKIPTLIRILSYFSVALLTLSSDTVLPCIGLILLFIFIPIIFIPFDEYNFDIASVLFGLIMFIGIGFYTLSNIRLTNLEEFIYLLLITVLTDTFAFFGGKLIGKHKLIPKISPKKTIEGSLIGTIMGTLIPSFYYLFMVDPGVNLFILVIMTFALSIMGQIGDLLFSAIKRYYKVKDFSNLLPGHGGILDRFDSLFVVGLVFTIIKALFL